MGRLLRYFFVTGYFAKAINNSFVQFLLPTLSGAYFLILDVWGTNWQLIAQHISAHKIIFAILLLATLFTQIFKEIGVAFFDANGKSYLGFLEGFMILAASAVDFKLKRFQDCAKNLKPRGNTFKTITQPKEQIEYIIDQSIKWLRDSFDLEEVVADETSVVHRLFAQFLGFAHFSTVRPLSGK